MKVTKITVLLITVSLLLIALCSCTAVDTVKNWLNIGDKDNIPIEEMSDPERAAAIFTRAYEKMDALDSCTSEAVMNIEMELYGVSITAEGRLCAKEQNRRTENFLRYTDSVISGASGDLTKSVTVSEGFQDGCMYRTQTGAESNYEIYSLITAAEYEKFIKEQNDSSEINLSPSDFNSLTSERTEEGWKVTLCGLKEDSKPLDFLNNLIDEDMMLALGVSFDDINMVVYTTSDYYCIKETLEFIYSGNEGIAENAIPTIYIENVYSNLNCTEVTKINTASFDQVYDIRLIEKAETAFKEFTESENGSFKFTYYEPGAGSNSSKSNDSYEMSYSTSEGKLSYTVTANVDGKTYNISYSNGKKATAEIGSNAIVDNSNDHIEREYVNRVAFPGSYTPDNVYLVEKGPTNNSFVLHMNLSNEGKENLFGSFASSVKDCKIKYTFYFDGDKITLCDARLTYSPSSGYIYFMVTDLVYD